MALTITRLASPSSFLLTLDTLDTSPAALSTPACTILLDPVLPPDSVLPTVDLVLVSSRRRCHEPTLRRLPSRSATAILAAPAAARRIRGWRHFDAAVVGTLPRWEDASSSSVLRFPVLSRVRQGSSEAGEITLTCIGRRHAAIGITYRPPTATQRWWCAGAGGDGPTLMLSPPPPPRLPTPALSFSSSSGDRDSPGDSPVFGPTSSPPRRRRCRRRRLSTLLPPSDRGISILFAPRGISSHRAFHSYATTHLLEQAVLPLTALLHPFDDPSSSFFPQPSGHETASALGGARAWIHARTGGEKARKSAQEVQRALDEPAAGRRRNQTEVRALAPGEELTMTSEGVWEEESLFAEFDDGDKGGGPERLFGLGLDIGVDEDGRTLGRALPVDWIDAVGSWSSVRMVQG